MYLHPKDPIALFEMPNTLAGDAALTIIIQTVVTWLIEWALVSSDLRAGKIAPAKPPVSRLLRRFLYGPTHHHHIPHPHLHHHHHHDEAEGGQQAPHNNDDVERTAAQAAEEEGSGPKRPPPLLLPSHLPRIVSILLPSFILFWPVSVAILTTVGTKAGGDWFFKPKWAVQIFKLILGGVLGLVITPLMALFWVWRDGLEPRGPEPHEPEPQ